MHYGYEFNTYTFTSLDFLHKLFYENKIKIIRPELKHYLTAQALAYWIMDDGGSIKSKYLIAI